MKSFPLPVSLCYRYWVEYIDATHASKHKFETKKQIPSRINSALIWWYTLRLSNLLPKLTMTFYLNDHLVHGMTPYTDFHEYNLHAMMQQKFWGVIQIIHSSLRMKTILTIYIVPFFLDCMTFVKHLTKSIPSHHFKSLYKDNLVKLCRADFSQCWLNFACFHRY